MVMKKFGACFVLFLFFSLSFVVASSEDFSVDSALLKMVVKEGELVNKNLKITSHVDGDFSVDKGDLDFISVDDFFSLSVGEEKTLKLKFNSSEMEPGIYFGEIVISNGNTVVLPIIFEVESLEVLFDGSISVPLEYGRVYPGGSLVAENKIFNLENIGLKNIDVHYFVEDFQGNSLFFEDENLAVETQALNTKSISIAEDVEPGDYLFGVVLKYGDSVGTSSYFFRVSEEEVVSGRSDENYFLWAVVVLLIFLVFFVIYYLLQRDKVFLELNRQYKREVTKEKCKKVKPKVLRKRLIVVKKIYRNRVRVVRKLKRHKKKNEVNRKLVQWKKEGYNVDEFSIGRKSVKEIKSEKLNKLNKRGYKL